MKKTLHELIKNGEDWLMSRILSYAKEHDYVKYTSTLKEAWRLSIAGLSGELLETLASDRSLELGAEDNYSEDPVVCMGMLQARKHRQRGVSVEMFLGLAKYYRQSYVDLVCNAYLNKEYEKKCLLLINRFFDRFEIGVSIEWAQVGGNRSYEELQLANLAMTNEKNKYLTIFESLGNPVILLDNNLQLHNINHAASKLFHYPKTPGGTYYGKNTIEGTIPWLAIELEAFAASNSTATCFTKEYKFNGISRFFEVKLRRMLDVSEKFDGIVVILNDITDYKQAQWELQSSYKELNQIFNTAADGMRIIDKNFNIIKVNDMFSDISGIAKEQAIGKKCYEVFSGPLCHTSDCCLNKIINGEKRLEFDIPKETIDGIKIPCIVTATPFHAPDGQLVGIVEGFKDITERKRIRKALLDSEERFRSLFHNINDAIFVQELSENGKSGNFIEINDIACKRLGYSRGELLERNFKDIDALENPAKMSEILRELMANTHITFETVHVSKYGQKIPVEVSSHLIYLNDEKVVLSVARDITDRKESEEILKRYEILFKNARDIILFVRRDGQIVEANDAAVREYGYSRDELLSKNIYDLRAKFTPVLTENQMEQADTTGILFETDHRRKNGSLFPVEVSSQGTVIAGERILLSVIRDISERKQAEEKLRAAHQQLLDIIEFLPDATFVVDENKKVLAWNHAMETITGIEGKDILGKGNEMYSKAFYGCARPILIDLVVGHSRKKWPYEALEINDHTISAESFVPALLNGKGAIIWGTASPLFDNNGNLVGAIESIRDITDRKNMEDELKHLSFHDSLTGLCNRTRFEQELNRLDEEKCYPVGIIVCDVDGLKLVNDTLGHGMGDKLLKAAANTIKKCFRQNDLVARIGGDEFAVLLPDSDKGVVKQAYLPIKDGIKNYNYLNPEFPLYISVGFAVREDDTVVMRDLFKIADNNMYREKLHHSKSTRSGIVQTLAKTMEARDLLTEGHGDRMQNLVEAFSLAAGVSEYRISDLRLLAKFHDIGKVGIPDQILFKPGPLTDDEMSEMQRHCEIGHRIALAAPELFPIADWILKHHEWWNGNGYPLGLKGDAIPLECRILTICDAYDAMTSDRLYRKAMRHEDAIAEIKQGAGIQFDPTLVHKFIDLISRKHRENCTPLS